MESQSNKSLAEGVDGAVLGWTLELVPVSQHTRTYRFQPSGSTEWCYLSGLSYPGNWFNIVNDPAISNTDYVQCTMWVDCVPFACELKAKGERSIVPPGMFNSLYGLFTPGGRDWWSIKVSTISPDGSTNSFPSGVNLYAVDEHGTSIAFIGFLDLTDPKLTDMN